MADRKFSELTTTASLADDDYIPAVAGGANKTITKENLKSTIGADARWEPLTATEKFITTVPSKVWDGSAFQTVSAWSSGSYSVGDFVKPGTPNGFLYECVAQTGATGGSEPSWGTTPGADTTDGSVTWRCRRWGVIETGIDMSSLIKVGMAIKFTYSATDYYGIVIGVSSAYIAVAGAGMLINVALSAVSYGGAELIRTLNLAVAGDYGASVQDILENVANQYVTWQYGRAHLVQFDARHVTDSGTTQPSLNVKIDGSAVCDDDSGNGVEVADSRVVTPYNSMNPSTYTIDKDDALELAVTVAETGTAGAHLSTTLVFVLE